MPKIVCVNEKGKAYATPEDLETTYNMLMALKKKERGNNVD